MILAFQLPGPLVSVTVMIPSSIVASLDRQQRWAARDSRGPTGTPGANCGALPG